MAVQRLFHVISLLAFSCVISIMSLAYLGTIHQKLATHLILKNGTSQHTIDVAVEENDGYKHTTPFTMLVSPDDLEQQTSENLQAITKWKSKVWDEREYPDTLWYDDIHNVTAARFFGPSKKSEDVRAKNGDTRKNFLFIVVDDLNLS